jgi:hypothetical protein
MIIKDTRWHTFPNILYKGYEKDKEEAKNYGPNTNYSIEMTMEVKARAIETLTNTNTTHHTHAVVKEVGVRLERTATRSQQGQNERVVVVGLAWLTCKWLTSL